MQPNAPATSPPAIAASRQPARVALREPDALLCALLEEWLRRAGFEPVRCGAAGSPDNVILVIADVPAPRQGGVACLAALRQSFPQAKVLAISAQFAPGMRGAITAAVELGADAVLAKPFGAKAFIDAAYAALGNPA